jgi:hypothetical protein
MKKNVKKQLAKKRPKVSRGFTSKTFDVWFCHALPYLGTYIHSCQKYKTCHNTHVKQIHVSHNWIQFFLWSQKHYPFQHGKIHVILNSKSYIDKQLKNKKHIETIKKEEKIQLCKIGISLLLQKSNIVKNQKSWTCSH